jgi:hypothetical protein
MINAHVLVRAVNRGRIIGSSASCQRIEVFLQKNAIMNFASLKCRAIYSVNGQKPALSELQNDEKKVIKP